MISFVEAKAFVVAPKVRLLESQGEKKLENKEFFFSRT